MGIFKISYQFTEKKIRFDRISTIFTVIYKYIPVVNKYGYIDGNYVCNMRYAQYFG